MHLSYTQQESSIYLELTQVDKNDLKINVLSIFGFYPRFYLSKENNITFVYQIVDNMDQYIVKCFLNNALIWFTDPIPKQIRDAEMKRCRKETKGVPSVQTVSKMINQSILKSLTKEIGNTITKNKLDKIYKIKDGNVANKRNRRIKYINLNKFINLNIEKIQSDSQISNYKIS